MMTYWQFMTTDNLVAFFFCLIAGAIMGLLTSVGECDNFKERAGWVAISVLFWAVISFPATTWVEYDKYKNHYTTCEKPVAKRAGYIFGEKRCWKPVSGYVTVNSSDFKTKGEIVNAK